MAYLSWAVTGNELKFLLSHTVYVYDSNPTPCFACLKQWKVAKTLKKQIAIIAFLNLGESNNYYYDQHINAYSSVLDQENQDEH